MHEQQWKTKQIIQVMQPEKKKDKKYEEKNEEKKMKKKNFQNENKKIKILTHDHQCPPMSTALPFQEIQRCQLCHDDPCPSSSDEEFDASW